MGDRKSKDRIRVKALVPFHLRMLFKCQKGLPVQLKMEETLEEPLEGP